MRSGFPSVFIDISLPLQTGIPVWPGDHPYQRSLTLDMEQGDDCNLSQMTLSCHTGTHIDAPLHFIRGGTPIDQLPLDAVIGRARIIDISNDAGDAPSISHALLLHYSIQSGERILFRTKNSRLPPPRLFNQHYVPLERDAARYLAACQVRTVGIDGPSVGGFEHDGPETHRELLGAGIWIIENLDLSAVEAGVYELICLPLRLIGAEGSPARAVLRRP